jgi:predicted ATPase/DNA-binding winged helix-turn-helix (wHTH) protein
MNDDEVSIADDIMSFGPFRLFKTKRLVETADGPLHLGGRALDILIALTDRAGEVVSKRELVAQVWPDVTVDDGSLRFHIAALRKALGDGQLGARYVTNVPGRGYCFVEPVSCAPAPKPLTKVGPAAAEGHRLPSRLMRMVGRDDNVLTISAQLAAHRFVTIVGPGGIGKTTVAVSVAHAFLSEFAGAVRFIDLGTLSDPRLVASSLASALGLPVSSDNAVPTLINELREKRMLLVFDSCEHVIEAIAALGETIFMESPAIHILATSREALRVEGEHIHRLFPLDYPPDDPAITAAEVLDFPAAQLFMERVAASTNQATLSDEDAPIVAEICRKLDGIALAIELAAGRVSSYGVREIAAVLDSQIGLLWHGRRTAPPRQQTLNATLDWSFNLLSAFERAILCRLSVLVGPFTLKAALAIAGKDEIEAPKVAEAIAGLVEKSLISTDLRSEEARYRLLDTTRAYAREKLLQSGDMDEVARRHATHCHDLLESDYVGVTDLIRPKEIDFYGEQVGNVRTALEWCFSLSGDVALGVALVAASAPLFVSMSLWRECQRWTGQAIAALDVAARGTRRELILLEALGKSRLANYDTSDAVRMIIVRAVEIAEKLGDTAKQIQLVAELRSFQFTELDWRGALEWALRIRALAGAIGDPAQIVLADSNLGMTYYVMGDQANARIHCEAALERSGARRLGDAGHFESDNLCQTRCVLILNLWLRGFPDQALAAAEQINEEAEATGDYFQIHHSLMWTIFIFLWSGHWEKGEYLTECLARNAEKHSMSAVIQICEGFKGQFLIKRGEVRAGIELVRKCSEVLQVKPYRLGNLVALAAGMAMIGDFPGALTSIDQAIIDDKESYRTSEIFRIKGDILASAPRPDLAAAEACLFRSADIARRQSALSWELRTATSLALLRQKQGRSQEGRDIITPVYARFTEGFDTIDLRTAKHLLDELA